MTITSGKPLVVAVVLLLVALDLSPLPVESFQLPLSSSSWKVPSVRVLPDRFTSNTRLWYANGQYHDNALNNAFTVLGVSPTASAKEIKQAYRRLAKQFHPDAVANNDNKEAATAKFQEINAAYERLTNPPSEEEEPEMTQQQNQNQYRNPYHPNEWYKKSPFHRSTWQQPKQQQQQPHYADRTNSDKRPQNPYQQKAKHYGQDIPRHSHYSSYGQDNPDFGKQEEFIPNQSQQRPRETRPHEAYHDQKQQQQRQQAKTTSTSSSSSNTQQHNYQTLHQQEIQQLQAFIKSLQNNHQQQQQKWQSQLSTWQQKTHTLQQRLSKLQQDVSVDKQALVDARQEYSQAKQAHEQLQKKLQRLEQQAQQQQTTLHNEARQKLQRLQEQHKTELHKLEKQVQQQTIADTKASFDKQADALRQQVETTVAQKLTTQHQQELAQLQKQLQSEQERMANLQKEHQQAQLNWKETTQSLAKDELAQHEARVRQQVTQTLTDDNAAEMTKLQEQLATMEQQHKAALAAAQSQIAQLQASLNDQERELAQALQSQQTHAQNEIQTGKTQIAQLQQAKQQLEEQFHEWKERQQKDLAKQQTLVTELQTQNQQLHAELDQVKGQNQQDASKQHNAFRQQIQGLEDELQDTRRQLQTSQRASKDATKQQQTEHDQVVRDFRRQNKDLQSHVESLEQRLQQLHKRPSDTQIRNQMQQLAATYKERISSLEDQLEQARLDAQEQVQQVKTRYETRLNQVELEQHERVTQGLKRAQVERTMAERALNKRHQQELLELKQRMKRSSQSRPQPQVVTEQESPVQTMPPQWANEAPQPQESLESPSESIPAHPHSPQRASVPLFVQRLTRKAHATVTKALPLAKARLVSRLPNKMPNFSLRRSTDLHLAASSSDLATASKKSLVASQGIALLAVLFRLVLEDIFRPQPSLLVSIVRPTTIPTYPISANLFKASLSFGLLSIAFRSVGWWKARSNNNKNLGDDDQDDDIFVKGANCSNTSTGTVYRQLGSGHRESLRQKQAQQVPFAYPKSG